MGLIKKYWLVGVVFGVVLVMIFVILSDSSDKNSQGSTKMISGSPTISTTTNKVSPTIALPNSESLPTAEPAAKFGHGPDSSPQEIKKQSLELEKNKSDYPLADKLPYKTSILKVDYYQAPKTLEVVIANESDKAAAQDEINKWLKDNGFDPSSHTIVWTLGTL